MRILGFLVVAVAAIGVMMVGCGGGDDEPAPLTKKAFLAKGNAICKKANDERDAMIKKALQEHQGEAASKADQEELVRAIIPALEPVPEELEELGPPKGDEAKVQTLIDGFEDSLKETDKDPLAAIAGETFGDIDAEMQKYGLTKCLI